MPPFPTRTFHDLICDFGRAHPDVRLQINYSTQLVDLHSGAYDVALRASTEMAPGLVARTLARLPTGAVASPKYLAERGMPRTRRDLRAHRCLMGFARGEVPQTHWPFPGGGKLHVEGAFFSNDVGQLAQAAVRGLGIAMLPLIVVSDELRTGTLVRVLEGQLGAEAHIAVVYPEREFVPPQVRAFVDAVVAWAPRILEPPGRAAQARKAPR